MLKRLDKPRGLKRRKAPNENLVRKLNATLDLGESEAIVLAKEIKADVIIIDEEKARRIAASEGLRVTGIMALLLHAKEKGLIMQIKPLLDELKVKGFFIGDDLYQGVLEKAKEI